MTIPIKPDEYPDWAAEDIVDVTSGQPNVDYPSSSELQYGFTLNEKPDRQPVNFLFRHTGLWIRYLSYFATNINWIRPSALGNAFATPSDTRSDVAAISEYSVAHTSNASSLSLMKYDFDGEDWSLDGNVLNPSVGSGTVAPALCRLNAAGNVALASNDSNYQLRAFGFVSPDWSQIGNTFSLPVIAAPSLAGMGENRIALAARTATPHILQVYDFDGEYDFLQVGNTYNLDGDVSSFFHSIASLNDTDIVLLDGYNQELTLLRFDGSDFSQLGSSLSVNAGTFGKVTGLNDTDVLISGASGLLEIYRFDYINEVFVLVSSPTSLTRSGGLTSLNGSEVASTSYGSNNLQTIAISFYSGPGPYENRLNIIS